MSWLFSPSGAWRVLGEWRSGVQGPNEMDYLWCSGGGGGGGF